MHRKNIRLLKIDVFRFFNYSNLSLYFLIIASSSIIFFQQLSANFTNVDLRTITEELEAAKRRVHEIAQTDPGAIGLERGLDSVMVQLSFYERNVVKPMQATADKVRVRTYRFLVENHIFELLNFSQATASNLDTKLRLGHSSFKEGMTDLIRKVQQAQNSLKNEGPKMIRQVS